MFDESKKENKMVECNFLRSKGCVSAGQNVLLTEDAAKRYEDRGIIERVVETKTVSKPKSALKKALTKSKETK